MIEISHQIQTTETKEGENKRKQPGSNNDQTQTKGDKDFYTREQGTQARTLKGRSDNETRR